MFIRLFNQRTNTAVSDPPAFCKGLVRMMYDLLISRWVLGARGAAGAALAARWLRCAAPVLALCGLSSWPRALRPPRCQRAWRPC